MQTQPVVNSEHSEIEELADMPLRAKHKDTDLVAQVEVSIRCHDLRHPDRSTLNAYVVMSAEDPDEEHQKNKLKEHARTEIVLHDASPVFIKTFVVNYYFEKQQRFQFLVINAEGDTEAQHRELGAAEFSIHELVCSASCSLTKPIRNVLKFSNGFLTASSNEMPTQHKLVTMQWLLQNCSFKSRQVYIRICRSSGEEFLPVYKSENSALKHRTTSFTEFQLTTHALCRDESSRVLKLEVYEASGTHIGSVDTSLEELQQRGETWEADIQVSSRIACTLKLIKWNCIAKTTFLDFVLGGCEISLVIGIDFTKSNRLPSEPDSLHFIGNDRPNEYIQAITAVGEILQYYDSDKRIPVFGFGAKMPPNFDVVSHCFALNDNIFEPEVQGIENVLQVYRSALSRVALHGPTVFSQLIQTARMYASAKELSQKNQQYCILLILTDGIINDMELTKEEIVLASELPMSIIVVGIGKEDFSMMKDLDSDDGYLESTKLNRKAVRDIVQFVPFSNFKGKSHELAREVLFEVPKQLISYFESKGIVPNRPKNSGDVMSSISSLNPQTPQLHPRRLGPPPLNRPVSTPKLLLEAKQNFIDELCSLGYEAEHVQDLIDAGLSTMNLQLAVEQLALVKPKPNRILKSAMKKRSGGHVSRTVSIKEADRCVICNACEVDTVLMECGHMIVCSSCVPHMNRVCPRCRQTVVKWVLIHK